MSPLQACQWAARLARGAWLDCPSIAVLAVRAQANLDQSIGVAHVAGTAAWMEG